MAKNPWAALLALAALCAASGCSGEEAVPQKDFPSEESIRSAWTARFPGLPGSFLVQTPRPISPESPEGKVVLSRFSWLQRRKIQGLWRVGRGFGLGSQDIKPPDFKGQNNSISSFPVCYVARTPKGYWLIGLVESWEWGKPPGFSGEKAPFMLE